MVWLLACLGGACMFILLVPSAVFRRRARQPPWLRFHRAAPPPSDRGWVAWIRSRPVRALGRMLQGIYGEPARAKTAQKLAQARMSERFAVEDIYTLKALAVLVPITYGLLIAVLAGSSGVLVIAGLMVPPLFMFPDIWLDNQSLRYKQQLVKELPSFLNTLAVTVDAGLNLLPALQNVCQRRSGALVEEFRRLLQDIEVKGSSQEDAFLELAQRCEVNEITLFASALEQALRRGGAGISVVLREQARMAWSDRRKRAEELAQKASFKMFLPLLMLVIPAIGIYMLGPTLILFWGDFSSM